jgi:acyl-CoA dehydrogenase
MSDHSFLIWPFFEDSHRQLADELEQWASEKLDHNSHEDVDATCRQLVADLAAGGWLNHSAADLSVNNSKPFDVRTLCLIRETLARHSGLADFAFGMQGLGSGSISLYGSDVIKQEYLPAVRAGRKIAAFALSEREAGSDVASLATTAIAEADEYIINGSKTWISNGGIADYYTVFARTGEAAGAKGLSAFVVDADTPGLAVTERINTIAPHPLASLSFTDCRVPKAKMLGLPGEGFKIALATLDIFRSTVGAAALGFARRALDETLKHTSTRELFGAPLANLQMTQAKIADMAVAIDASALLIYRAAWTRDCVADRVTREASMAKLYATESAQQVIDQAVQLFGGRGVVSGVKVEELYREIRALRIYEGASEVQKLIIAKQTLAESSVF